MNSQLLQAQKMELLGQLAAGVAHDFNNLLTVIIGVADLRCDLLPAGDPVRADLDVIKVAGERAARLTAQLLGFSRSSRVQPRVLDVHEQLRFTERMLRRVIGEDIVLETRFDARDPLIFMDPMQLDVVMLNLAINARDAMPGGGTLAIECSDSPGPGEGWIEIRVADSGIGISEEVKKHLFQPFFTTKAVGRGTGLGLAACYGIVTSVGGSIRVSSVYGRGSEFTLAIPRCRQEAPDLAGAGDGRIDCRGRGETLLLVEDDPEVRSICELSLRQQGYRVLCAKDGADALHQSRYSRNIDLLVSDLVMDGMDGVALYEKLKERRPGLPALFISGYDGESRGVGSKSQPGLDLLRKPFLPGKLARRVRSALDTTSRRLRIEE